MLSFDRHANKSLPELNYTTLWKQAFSAAVSVRTYSEQLAACNFPFCSTLLLAPNDV